MKIHRLRITNYRGIEQLDAEIPPAGVVAKGRNAQGKTSVLRAIRATLAARDIGPDAIRVGAERAELLIDLGHHTVRRTITASGGGSLVVENGEGDRKRAPQAWLTEMLGTSPLDPLDLFLAPAKQRREIVLAALPVKLTTDRVREWLAPELFASLPETLVTPLEGMHGLDACALLHRHIYDRRTTANAEVKGLRAALERQELEVTTLAKGTTPATSDEAEQLQLTATRSLEDARRVLAGLAAREREAKAFATRTAAARATIAARRAEAERLRATSAAVVPNVDELRVAAADAVRAREAARVAYEAAVARSKDADAALQTGLDALGEQERASAAAADRDRVADELEATLAATSVDAPAAEEQSLAERELEGAQASLDAAQKCVELARAADLAADTRAQLATATAAATALHDAVTTLAKDGPAQLLRESRSIPGLGLAGDEITVDGVRLDALSGKEQMRLAVEIARRANARSKILVVDGLERLDPEQLEAFVAFATADDWQLIATRVDAGEMVLEAIAVDGHEEGAAA